ncbi:hypothetical protein OG223_35430 [Streptomyces sp. NBC_01478]|uniref:hypothetical protein n=1 Tax=Streptomyces sp. NBC_01478 TaxID=2903882 RepID=UPI002E33BE37|nr:hypothetical protein [Streptomyces sp. NBC_01478]
MDDSASVSARRARADYNALEAAADEVLTRKALRTLAEEGDAPCATLTDVLADIFGTSAPDEA